MSVYYWGYIAGHIGGGIAADTLGVRKWASVMLLGWCLLTALTGMCHTLWQFGIVRGLFGITEGAVANPLQKLENQWVLPRERGWVYGVLLFSGYLGLIIGMPLVGWLMTGWGWRVMFYFTGALTLLAAGLFWLLVYDHPREHPWMSPEEKTLIEETLTKDRVTFDAQAGVALPLSLQEGIRILVKNWAFWGTCVVGFFVLGAFFANLSWLPGYLVKERGYTVMHSGLYLVIPYLAASVGGLLGGYLGDRVGNRSLIAFCAGIFMGPAMVGLMLSRELVRRDSADERDPLSQCRHGQRRCHSALRYVTRRSAGNRHGNVHWFIRWDGWSRRSLDLGLLLRPHRLILLGVCKRRARDLGRVVPPSSSLFSRTAHEARKGKQSSACALTSLKSCCGRNVVSPAQSGSMAPALQNGLIQIELHGPMWMLRPGRRVLWRCRQRSFPRRSQGGP